MFAKLLQFLLDPDDGTASGGEPPVEEAPELDLDGELSGDTFDRDYVTKVRSEAARHRTSARDLQAKYDAIYEGFEDSSDVDYLLDLARRTLADPASSVSDWERILNNIREQSGPAEDPDPNAEPEYLTRADFDRIEMERATERAQADIMAEAKALGYDESSHLYKSLMWIAANETKGDLAAAHAKLEAEREGIGKAAVEAYLAGVSQGSNDFPALSGGSSGAGAPAGSAGASSPKTIKEASESALRRLSEM